MQTDMFTVVIMCVQLWSCVYSCGHVCTVVIMCVQLWSCVYSCDHVCTVVIMCVQLWSCVYSCDHMCTVVIMFAQLWSCVYSGDHVCTVVIVCVQLWSCVAQFFWEWEKCPRRKLQRKSKNTFYYQWLFFPENRSVVEKYCAVGKATDDSVAHAHCILDT